MDALIIALAVYFIKIKRYQWFEWAIIVCLFMKYALYALYALYPEDEFTQLVGGPKSALFIILVSLIFTLGPISHMIYTSQYVKTCFLVRGMEKKAVLLFERHKTVIDQYDSTLQWKEFVHKHNSIDEMMKQEIARSRKIYKIFLFIDIVLMTLMPCIEGFLWYEL